MKIAKIFSVLLAGALAFASCDLRLEEKQQYAPGQAEDPNCYGVYFPTQEATGSHIVDPTAAKEVTFTVARKKSEGAIDVPFKLISDSDVFVPGKLSFEDGQSETTLTVTYDKAETGNQYAFQLEITDNQYAALYSDQVSSLSFDVLLVSWSYLGAKDGEAVIVSDEKDAAIIDWWNGWDGKARTGILKFYEVDGLRHCVTVTDGGAGFFGAGEEIEFLWRVKDNYVFYEPIYVVTHPSYGEDVYMYDEYGYWNYINSSEAGNYADAIDYYTKYPSELPLYCSYYENGGIYLKAKYFYMLGLGGWGTDNTVQVEGLARGVTRVDYTLEMETEYSYNGVFPLYFEVGTDVASVKVAGAQGELGAKDIAALEAGIADGSIESVELDLEELELGLEFEESGMYTVAAVAFNEAGEVVNDAVVSGFYVSADPEEQEKYAVKVSVGLEAVPERYHLPDYSSAAFWVAGEDLTEVHMAVVKASQVDQKFLATLATSSKYAVSADELETINGVGGMYDYMEGLEANTKYAIVVWATNGALETFDMAQYTTAKAPYEWVSLGKGALTDDVLALYSVEDLTVEVDVFEEKNTPGLYMFKGHTLKLAANAFGVPESVLANYEDIYWSDVEILIDAADPKKVVWDFQSYGVCLNPDDGFILFGRYDDEDAYGTLKDGVITWPVKGLTTGLPLAGKLYYGNVNGTQKLVLPSAASSSAVKIDKIEDRGGSVRDMNTVLSPVSSYNKLKIERDLHTVSAKVVKLAPRAKSKFDSKPVFAKNQTR